jgi:hypothetical protein
MVVRTYAPVGRTPILKEKLTRDHLSAMSAITLEGKLYMKEQERSFKAEDAVRFLKSTSCAKFRASCSSYGTALRSTAEERSRTFSGEWGVLAAATGAVTRLRTRSQSRRGSLWKHLKCVELKNLCCESLAELKVELRKAKERLRHKRDVILGCIRQPGFEV